MRARLLRRQDPVLHLLRHPRVVLGELRELPLAEQEQPAVADVRSDERGADDGARRERRSHPAELRHGDPLRIDLEVRLLHGAPQALPDRPAARRAVHLARQHLEREVARDFAAGVAADPVRHREDEAVLVRPVADRVLVLGADAADVGQLEELDLRHDARAGGIVPPART